MGKTISMKFDQSKEGQKFASKIMGVLKKNIPTRRAEDRLKKIANIIEGVDERCMAADGPVTPTLEEMTQEELSKIYKLAKGESKWK